MFFRGNEAFSYSQPYFVEVVSLDLESPGKLGHVGRQAVVHPSVVQAANVEPDLRVVHGSEVLVRVGVGRIPLEEGERFVRTHLPWGERVCGARPGFRSAAGISRSVSLGAR